MEILLIAILAGLAGWFFFLRNKENKPLAPTSVAAPYKVETPAEGQPTPEVKMVPEDVAPAAAPEVVAEAPAKKARKPRAAKAEAAVKKKAVAKKPAAMKAKTSKSKKA